MGGHDDSTINADTDIIIIIIIIRQHRSTTYTLPIVTDGVAWSVCLPVCQSVTIVCPAETVEPIEMSFGTWTRVGPRKHVLDGGAHWRNLANTTEPSVCSRDAALCQITLTTCYYFARGSGCEVL